MPDLPDVREPVRRVAVSGAVSVGKTTLVKGLTDHLRQRFSQLDVLVIGNVSRDLVARGRVRADKESASEHYCLYVGEYLRRLLAAKADLVIHDRTLLDTLCYVVANGNASAEFVEMLEQIVRLYVRDIELYFYLPIELPIREDGMRLVDLTYRETVDRLLRANLDALCVDYKTVTGSPDERLDTVARWLTQKLAL